MAGFFQVERALLDRMGRSGNLTVADFQVIMIAMRDTKLPGDPVGLGIDYLAGDTGLGRRTVIRSRRKLVQLGYLIPDSFGQRGLACFAVATGAMNGTPGAVDGTCRTDARGATGDTGTGAMDGTPFTLLETGNSSAPHNDEKPPSSSSVDEQAQTDLQSGMSTTSDTESPPHALALVPPPGKKKGGADVPPAPGAKGKALGKTKKPKKAAKANTPDFPAWLQWVDACRKAGRDDPAPSVGAVKAARTLTAWYPDAEERRRVMEAYLRLDDNWVRRQGYQLALLVTNCIEAVRESMRSGKSASATSTGTAAKSVFTPSTGEAKRMAQYFKKDPNVRYDW